MERLYPVILSGGSGSRLWPLSRQSNPKQLLPLVGRQTLLEATLRRVSGSGAFHPPTLVVNAEHRFAVAEQARLAGTAPRAILLEAVGRNTAPAILCAALDLLAADDSAIMLVLPSDHLIRDAKAFRRAVETARAAAAAGRVMTLGITPDRPETGYGWIEKGGALDGLAGAFEVARFKEKPDAATAAAMLADGRHLWNAGIFVLPAARVVAELERLEPELVQHCRDALDRASKDIDFTRLDPESFGQAKAISIDYALVERVERVGTVAVEMGWSDLGGFDALYEVAERDEQGNATVGRTALLDARDCHVRSNGRLVTVLGLEGVLVVETDDAVLVADRGRAQDVKQLVEKLKSEGFPEATQGSKWHRPWGWFQTLDMGERFQVKRISVNPGASLSLQMHHHRAEHWIVVSGTAEVNRETESFLLAENESTYIPLGQRHRLTNPGRVQLEMIEVQSGAYLGEDDIVRFDDNYGRQ
ncbi:mannose-1-phosphate guanylyltransferase (GDP) /mannose-6-phosphate isomerase, type 2 [Tistlia consotensis]|uniref:mannose-1-phosphate guanylyltransferase n=1 Tax=Tistlia consotensis USBA 355 TaxID=560819 RepID=A0A1Y6B9D5_9PROT|nr:mannose-1-phosphate guanylyltransferase/mannose-6-phosphate isomerase [Tistlia consotensis]SME98272.1 mannose-1-phosphate guanylyltransferase (GDP) /mannose-6-phosphate isomerase, type 2 [Tistlia consotensis USBA 355]SNR57584.1 mannose-1-phosphate guanylyltransferase (GDP) /mannose-6-phosphate isomerase, type 2 [Tistlia consotensis]